MATSPPSALACPDSLKGVLPARVAAAALAEGFASVGVACEQLPLADGGEGTAEALAGRLPDGAVCIEAALHVPFGDRLVSSRPLAEAIAAVSGASHLYVGLGGTGNMDGGAGLLEALDALPCPTTVLCDVRTTLYDAPRLFGPQKGATTGDVASLEARLRADERLAPYASLPGSGAAGGLGAALASLGAELVPGAPAVLDLVGFDVAAAAHGLVVTGEGRVDATTGEGKVAAEVARRAPRCVVFGGVVETPLPPPAETIALSGDRTRARTDLVELGRALGLRLLDASR
jgi:glycerate kinase